jgi:hypothetical protein
VGAGTRGLPAPGGCSCPERAGRAVGSVGGLLPGRGGTTGALPWVAETLSPDFSVSWAATRLKHVRGVRKQRRSAVRRPDIN